MSTDLLRQLAQEFGVNDKGEPPLTHEETYAKHRWTLRKVNLDEIRIANQIVLEDRKKTVTPEVPAQPKAPVTETSVQPATAQKAAPAATDDEDYDLEHIVLIKVQTAFVATYLAAIDGIPTWKYFQTAAESDLEGNHELDPPLDVKKRTAASAYKFFIKARKMGLISHLFATYEKVFAEKVNPEKPQGKGEPIETGDETDRPV